MPHSDIPTLTAALGDYPHTAALRDGRVSSDRLRLEMPAYPVISRAFAPMIREAKFDVSEMAIVSFLQAKSYGKPIVLLPVVMAERFQEGALLTRVEGGIAGPGDLAGKRVGVRTYIQTTGTWLRGVLADSHGITPDRMNWVTWDDSHSAEYCDPPWSERAPAGSDMLTMLKDGQLDAAIFGNDVPTDAAIRPVFPDVAAAEDAFRRRYGLMPVNHMVVVRSELAAERPELVAELVRLLRLAGARIDTPSSLRPAVELALRFSAEQGLLGRPMMIADVWEGLPDC